MRERLHFQHFLCSFWVSHLGQPSKGHVSQHWTAYFSVASDFNFYGCSHEGQGFLNPWWVLVLVFVTYPHLWKHRFWSRIWYFHPQGKIKRKPWCREPNVSLSIQSLNIDYTPWIDTKLNFVLLHTLFTFESLYIFIKLCWFKIKN